MPFERFCVMVLTESELMLPKKFSLGYMAIERQSDTLTFSYALLLRKQLL
jgi:hypothetical protein